MRNWDRVIAALIAVAVSVWFLSSRLSFAPVPWPDGSAFYLPSLEIFSWPPQWRMHAQAAFVPSYDIANFNLMPGLPLVLGFGNLLGFNDVFGGPTLGIRVVSMIALVAYAWVLWRWLLRKKLSAWIAAAVALAGFLDPLNRWGTFVVRTETWIGLAWVFILIALYELSLNPSKKEESKSLWRVAAGLAIAAYFHFEAIVLVPAVVLGLYPTGSAGSSPIRAWIGRLLGVGARTVLFLSPWLIYVLSHFGLFLDQMDVQFHRLHQSNHWIETPYIIFHSLFVSLGSPQSWPKFFNVGKGVFWGLLIGMSLVSVLRMRRPVVLAAAFACWASMYLWFTKPEVWFVTLIHLTIWPWVGALLVEAHARGQLGRGWKFLTWPTAAYAALAFFGTIGQQVHIPDQYSWPVYRKWVDCLQSTIERNVQKTGTEPIGIWQPHVPDALVELSHRNPRFDLTRTLDFNSRVDYAWELTKRTDAIIFSRHYPMTTPDGGIYEYQGVERPEDHEMLMNGLEVPFGPWAYKRFPVEQPGQWKMEVCQIGPFWANIAVRK